MAIAFDASSSGIASATSVTFSQTCTGSDLVLVVNAYVKGDNISSVTYNGVAMTQVAAETSGNPRVYTYVLIGPATGTHNVVVTGGASAVVTGGSAISFSGATGGYSATGSSTGSSTSASLTINTNKQTGFVVAGYGSANAGVPTYTGGGTQYGVQTSSNDRIRSAYEAFTGGADKTETWSIDAIVTWRITGVEVYELGATGGFFLAAAR